jgi:hypothetical protein
MLLAAACSDGGLLSPVPFCGTADRCRTCWRSPRLRVRMVMPSVALPWQPLSPALVAMFIRWSHQFCCRCMIVSATRQAAATPAQRWVTGSSSAGARCP